MMEVGNQTAQVNDPALAAWRSEVQALRRRVWMLSVLSGLLIILSATLLALLLSA
jgi:hypothetical protein